MEALPLLLMLFAVCGCSYKLQSKLGVVQTAGTDTDQLSEMRREQPRDVSSSSVDRKHEDSLATVGERSGELVSPETSAVCKTVKNQKTVQGGKKREDESKTVKKNETEIRRNVEEALEKVSWTQTGDERTTVKTVGNHKGVSDEAKYETEMKFKTMDDQTQQLKQTVEEEERDGELDAGIRLYEETRGDDGEIQKIAAGGQGMEEEKEESEERQKTLPFTPTQIPLVSSPPPTTVIPQLLPSSATAARSAVSVDPVSLTEEPLTEVLQSPGHHNKQKNSVVLTPNVENAMVKNLVLKPAHVGPKTMHTIIHANESRSVPKPKEARSKESSPTPPPAEHELPAKAGIENGRVTEPQPTTFKRPLLRPAQSKSSEDKTIHSKETKRKKDIKTRTPTEKKKRKNKEKKKKKKKVEEEEDIAATGTDFPYFRDNYCPPECACYGRVIQCSDKGMDTVPYGIPYNARYILLMSNHITGIQLDLLSEYVSMEFLVLSNNQLTNGAIEGAFNGALALKRLYLDGNLLESVPTDLPVPLEEVRLDSNRLSVMSEAAWARCPGLLVLSLSNNSLGNGSESLLDAVFSPLRQLRALNLDRNQLTSVPLGLPLSIKELYLKGNLIEQFRGGVFDGVSGLLVLDLSANRLTDRGLLRDSLVNASRLESVNLEGNRLKQVPRHLPLSLKTLSLEGNLITSIKKAAFRALKNLEHLGLARNEITRVAPGAFRALPVLHQLDLCHNALHQVPRQLPPGLHSAAFTHNKIGWVPRDAFCWGNHSRSLSGLVRVRLEHNFIDMAKLDVQAFRCLRGFQVVHFS